jgi:hypothetical protein
VERNQPPDDANATAVETVRCLSCGVVYAKPAGGGTVSANPGCPECAYVGWVTTESRLLTTGLVRRRFSSDPPRRRSA